MSQILLGGPFMNTMSGTFSFSRGRINGSHGVICETARQNFSDKKVAEMLI